MPKLTTGPDPHPKKPKIKAPPGACDTHIHLFGPAAKYPFAPDSPYIAHEALAETFMALQDTLGMSTAVIVSPGGYGRNYSLLADVLTKYPKRFRGIALLRDDTPSSEVGRLTTLGVRGTAPTSSITPTSSWRCQTQSCSTISPASRPRAASISRPWRRC